MRYVDIKFKEMTKIINKGLKKNKNFSLESILKTIDFLNIKKKYREELKNMAIGYVDVKLRWDYKKAGGFPAFLIYIFH